MIRLHTLQGRKRYVKQDTPAGADLVDQKAQQNSYAGFDDPGSNAGKPDPGT